MNFSRNTAIGAICVASVAVTAVVYHDEMASFLRSTKSFGKLLFGSNKYSGDSNWKEEDGLFYDKNTKNIDGEDISLSKFYGNVSLVTNVACQCGYTKPSYTEMEKYSELYYDKGLRFILFPSNEFFGQEPGTPNEIKEFVKDGYPKLKPDFMNKSEVNGDKTNDIYKYLKKVFPGDISWNFATKFIIGKDGKPVKRFDKNDGWEKIEECIKEELAKEYNKPNENNNNENANANADSNENKDDQKDDK